MDTWRKLIGYARGHDELIRCTLSEDEMDVEFNARFGGGEGKPFTAWSKSRVYFPVACNGAEWVNSVPRNPCDEASEHCGGEL